MSGKAGGDVVSGLVSTDKHAQRKSLKQLLKLGVEDRAQVAQGVLTVLSSNDEIVATVATRVIDEALRQFSVMDYTRSDNGDDTASSSAASTTTTTTTATASSDSEESRGRNAGQEKDPLCNWMYDWLVATSPPLNEKGEVASAAPTPVVVGGAECEQLFACFIPVLLWIYLFCETHGQPVPGIGALFQLIWNREIRRQAQVLFRQPPPPTLSKSPPPQQPIQAASPLTESALRQFTQQSDRPGTTIASASQTKRDPNEPPTRMELASSVLHVFYRYLHILSPNIINRMCATLRRVFCYAHPYDPTPTCICPWTEIHHRPSMKRRRIPIDSLFVQESMSILTMAYHEGVGSTSGTDLCKSGMDAISAINNWAEYHLDVAALISVKALLNNKEMVDVTTSQITTKPKPDEEDEEAESTTTSTTTSSTSTAATATTTSITSTRTQHSGDSKHHHRHHRGTNSNKEHPGRSTAVVAPSTINTAQPIQPQTTPESDDDDDEATKHKLDKDNDAEEFSDPDDE
ncbi:hypothetical protein Pelo_17308 [Pelomyxa schiedti]|nr:hypothetical protein Pelo_17308 [Pelomyxa schiedti]